MPYGLKPETVEQLTGVFTRFPHIETVILYGSRAKGNFKPGSDIDFSLLGELLTREDLGKIEEAIDDLFLPYMVDLSLFREISLPSLREHIHRVGVVFFGKNPGSPFKTGGQERE